MTSRPAAAQHLRDLAWPRSVRDRIDREYAQPLHVEAIAPRAHMSAGYLSREFLLASDLVAVPPSVHRRQAWRAAAGMPPYAAKRVTRPIRNRDAPTPERHPG